jgi:hypothetical protein
LLANAKHSSGLYYRALTTGADGGGDAPTAIDTMPSDALLSDVQGGVMLAFMRANEVTNADTATFAPFALYDFVGKADALFQALGAANLWDATGGGYSEGFVPSSSTMLTNKTTRSNAAIFAALHRKFLDMPPRDAGPQTPEVVVLHGLRMLLIQQVTAHGSLFAVVDNQTGYFRAATHDFRFTSEPRAASYTAAANAAALEGLSEQAYGRQL